MSHVSPVQTFSGASLSLGASTRGLLRSFVASRLTKLESEPGYGFNPSSDQNSRGKPSMIEAAGETASDTAESPHVPVLAAEALQALAVSQDGLYLDGTFGAGGYSWLILEAGGRVLALDRDPTAIAAGQALVEQSGGKLILAQTRFSKMETAARAKDLGAFDGIALDIGVSSMQFDQAERGFSFRFDGPLDMRMERAGRSAADLVNELEAEPLANILYLYGEERASRRIARAIVAERAKAPILTTGRLAEIIARAAPSKKFGEIHPATRSFQALRIAVNEELDELTQALAAAERLLRPGGRLAVVTFHSLEDRIVKHFFAERAGRGRAVSRLLPGEIPPPPSTFIVSHGQPIVAGPQECLRNPRARSAKLRWGERTQAPPTKQEKSPVSERDR
jgi:16S rRNA (cytosine1402-N4)-methyltransferase